MKKPVGIVIVLGAATLLVAMSISILYLKQRKSVNAELRVYSASISSNEINLILVESVPEHTTEGSGSIRDGRIYAVRLDFNGKLLSANKVPEASRVSSTLLTPEFRSGFAGDRLLCVQRIESDTNFEATLFGSVDTGAWGVLDSWRSEVALFSKSGRYLALSESKLLDLSTGLMVHDVEVISMIQRALKDPEFNPRAYLTNSLKFVVIPPRPGKGMASKEDLVVYGINGERQVIPINRRNKEYYYEADDADKRLIFLGGSLTQSDTKMSVIDADDKTIFQFDPARFETGEGMRYTWDAEHRKIAYFSTNTDPLVIKILRFDQSTLPNGIQTEASFFLSISAGAIRVERKSTP